MARAFTTKAVEAAKPDPVRRRELPDPAAPGLYLVVQPSGIKSWAFRYRYAEKHRKLTLGRWPILGLAEARAAAAEAAEAVHRGEDPCAAKKRAKAERIEAQLSERDKVKTLVGQYAKRHLSGLRSGEEVKAQLRRHVLPAWGDRDVQEITRRDVRELLDKIADSGRVATANRVRAYLSHFFGWLVERDVIATSPAIGVKPVAKESSRDRVLTDDEVRWFWKACDDLGQPWGAFGKVLLLTGQRRGEVVGMTDAELRGETWHLSAARTKNGRAHDVPLTEAVRAVLEGMERVKGAAGLYHTTNGETPLSGFHKGRDHVAKQMAKVAAEERGEPVEIPRWTFHDLRRTAATGMARLGIPVRVTEAVLNHVSGTGGGIVAVYQRHDYADEKRAALEAWARFVAEIVENRPADNVVRIEGAGR